MMWTRKYTRRWFAWYPVEIQQYNEDGTPRDFGDRKYAWLRWVDRHAHGISRHHTLPKEGT